MKKTTGYLLALCISFIGFVALRPLAFPRPAPASPVAATVEPLESFYVFAYSRPNVAFDSLAVIKVPQKFTGEPIEQLRTAMNEARKKYPTANAIIFTGNNMQTATIARVLQ